MITVLCGGVGAARYLAGLVQVVDPASVTAIVNTGDDTWMHGLRICPDLDTVTYTLAGAINQETGWGLGGETWQAMDTLRRYDAGRAWFGLGDRDLGTHLYRTARLAEGAPLSAVTGEIVSAWGLGLRVLPMTDDPVATKVTVEGMGEIGFQEYFVREQHSVVVQSVRLDGIDSAPAAAGVLEAIAEAERIVVAPSNPIVSIGPVLAVASVRAALAARRADVVAISPIVAGAALKGPADRLLVELGHESSVVGVARLYRDIAATLVVDEADAGLASAVEDAGMTCVVAPTVMHGPTEAAALAKVTLS
ncbi:MAG: 2-phospho-L-lactate transferase [Acidobacteria bacterium]|nr:2-phospho-L-lactate transferase [Acidobacteriota bacterium]